MTPPKTVISNRNIKIHLRRNNCPKVTKARYLPSGRPSTPHPSSSSSAQRPPGASPIAVIVINDDGDYGPRYTAAAQHRPRQADPYQILRECMENANYALYIIGHSERVANHLTRTTVDRRFESFARNSSLAGFLYDFHTKFLNPPVDTFKAIPGEPMRVLGEDYPHEWNMRFNTFASLVPRPKAIELANSAAQSAGKYTPPNLLSLELPKIHPNIHDAFPEWAATGRAEQPEGPEVCEVCLEGLPTVKLDCSENHSPEPHSLCPRCVFRLWHSQLSNAAPNQPLRSTISCPKCRSIVHRVWADNILGEYSDKPRSDGSWDFRLEFTKYVGLIPWMARRSLHFSIVVSFAYR